MIRACIADPIIRPTGLQRALAYLRTGSLPPLPALSFAGEAALSLITSSALCLLLGYLLGSTIAP